MFHENMRESVFLSVATSSCVSLKTQDANNCLFNYAFCCCLFLFARHLPLFLMPFLCDLVSSAASLSLVHSFSPSLSVSLHSCVSIDLISTSLSTERKVLVHLLFFLLSK